MSITQGNNGWRSWSDPESMGRLEFMAWEEDTERMWEAYDAELAAKAAGPLKARVLFALAELLDIMGGWRPKSRMRYQLQRLACWLDYRAARAMRSS